MIILSISSFEDINDIHKSMLQEICNMGAGNAATSVSQLISSPTDIGVPQVKVNPVSLAGRVADMLSKSAVTYHIELKEDILGSLLFIFPYPFIERLARTFFPDIEIKDENGIDEMTSSVIGETVNITAAAFANSLANMTGFIVDISAPEPAKVPSDKVFSDKNADSGQACFVSNSIEILDCRKSYTVLLYPELDSVNKIMEKFGM